MKNIVQKLYCFLFFVMILTTCIVPVEAASDYDFKIMLVHTNDVHANVDIEPYVRGLSDKLKANGENVVLISAGDALAGTSFASLSAGMDCVTVMNMVGYDMLTIGNHEQFMTIEAYKEAAEASLFPHLGANTNDVFKSAGNMKDYIIKEIEGVKIAFIGLTTSDGDYTEGGGAEYVAAAEAAKVAAEAEGATVFVGVVHLGINDPNETKRSTYIAQKCPWFTVLVDGHCHTALENGVTENGVLIAETGEYGNNIGIIELQFKNAQVINKTASLIPIKGAEDTCGITPNAEIAGFISDIRAKNDMYLQEVVASFSVELDGSRETTRKQETALGDILTDAIVRYTDADIALFPAPYIRNTIAQGDFTRNNYISLLLNEETMYLPELSGQQILDLIELMLIGQPEVSGYFRQISGLLITYDETRSVGSRVVTIASSDGSPLDMDKLYTVAVTGIELQNVYGDEWKELNLNIPTAKLTANEAFLKYVNSGEITSWEMDGRLASIHAGTKTQLGHSVLYVVRKGDNLSKISFLHYGTKLRWQEIYKANKDIICDPNLIFVGQQLQIP